MHVVYNEGTYHKDFDAEAGDIIITFYDSNFDNKIVLIKNKDWSENLKKRIEDNQREKEAWASSKNLNCCDKAERSK